MPNTIQLTPEFRKEEAVASSSISPGMLVELDSNGKVKVHATEGGFAERAFAVEDALQGKTVDDDYSTGDRVTYHLVPPGAEVMAVVDVGENIAIGDQLISKGDGTLIEVSNASSGTTVKQVIAIALEALDQTSSGAVDRLCRVRVL